jgi:mRNA-degrading endonuclease YafQ of YafQ-DinJ toxin-antitoxin module
MPSQVKVTSKFEKDVKRLKRKYPAVTGEVHKLVEQLEDDKRQNS